MTEHYFRQNHFGANHFAENHLFGGTAVPPPPPPPARRRFGAAPTGGSGCFVGGGLRKRPVGPEGAGAAKEPSFAEAAVDVLRSGKAHERRPKASPRPERETIYDLRSRLAGIREKVARLEAERRRLAQATAEQRAQHQAEVREVLLQVATLERDLLEAERDRATLLGALEAQQAAHMRGATLIGSSLAISGLTLAAIPAKYAWMGYTVAAGLALWGLFEFILPVGRQSANGAEPAGGPAKEEALAH